MLLFGTDSCAHISFMDQTRPLSMTNDNSLHQLLVEFFNLPLNTPPEEISQQLVGKWDSLAMVQLITELERRYSVEFDLDEIQLLRSYAEIREALTRKGLVFEDSATLPG
jgi:acyl carrier protein